MNKKIVNVAIIGSPNVGKSSMLNWFTGEKNSIVSPTPHTTRDAILGVCNHGDIQIIFIDTPGYLRKGNKWSQHFISETLNALRKADVVIIVVDALETKKFGTDELLDKFASLDNTIVAINKRDLRSKGKLYEPALHIASYGYKNVVYLVSAKTGEGMDDLCKSILEFARDGDWIFESNDDAQLAKEVYGSECVREKIFYCTRQEVPFGIYTFPLSWDFDKKPWTLRVGIVVEKESHKSIVIGQNGSMIKKIGVSARSELEIRWGAGNLFTQVFLAKDLNKLDIISPD